MYTGYFARLNVYKKAGLTPVSVCLKAPDYYDGLEYKKLAPTWKILNEYKGGVYKGDKLHYTDEYVKQVIYTLYLPDVISDLEKLTNSNHDKIILLCWEKSDDFCHRNIIGCWMNANHFNCKEYEVWGHKKIWEYFDKLEKEGRLNELLK